MGAEHRSGDIAESVNTGGGNSGGFQSTSPAPQRTGNKLNTALKIQTQMLGRPPSITELVLFSIQGSEHCSYKSSRTHLKNFITTGPDVILGAKEDAGVISITKDKKGNKWCIVMSHESHNHPSQIVPYEGAATGVGGNVRDVMCMGAEVISNSDSLSSEN